MKNREEELALCFPLGVTDKMGSICLKFVFLHETVLARVLLVLDQVRVLLINSDSELVLMGLLEMLVTRS